MFRAAYEILNFISVLLWNGEWRAERMGRPLYTLPAQRHGQVQLSCLVCSVRRSSDSSCHVTGTRTKPWCRCSTRSPKFIYKSSSLRKGNHDCVCDWISDFNHHRLFYDFISPFLPQFQLRLRRYIKHDRECFTTSLA